MIGVKNASYTKINTHTCACVFVYRNVSAETFSLSVLYIYILAVQKY